MTPVVLNHEIPFSPALTGEAGSLYNIFKWALPQLGWTLAFDDEPGLRAAFRNDPVHGSGCYLMIWDDPDDHERDARRCRAQVYLDMIDIDTGVDPAFSAPRYVAKPITADATARQWYVIGDNRRFHFMRDASGASTKAGNEGFNWYPVGDFKKYFPGDPCEFICPLGNGNPTSQNWASSLGIAYSGSSSGGVNRTDTEEGFPLKFDRSAPGTLRLRSFGPGGANRIAGSNGSVLDTSNPAARIIVSENWAPRGEIVGALNPLQNRPFGGGVHEVQVHNGREVTDALYFNATPYGGETDPRRGS